MSFWGVEVKPENPVAYPCSEIGKRVRITQATLGDGDSVEKSVLQCTVGRRAPVFLCALLPDNVESCTFRLEFEEPDGVVFSVTGRRSIHLAGYYVYNDQTSHPRTNTEPHGLDIENNESEKSNQNNEDGKYEDVEDTESEKSNQNNEDGKYEDVEDAKSEKYNQNNEDDSNTHDILDLIPGDSQRKKRSSKKKTCKKKKKQHHEDVNEMKSLSNGLIIEELGKGDPHGEAAASGKMVEVNFTGMLKENGYIFESSVGRVRLGDDEMIDGFNMGVVGMRVGDKRRLIIPPSMGFGEDGVIGQNVPPNAWLVYDVEFLGVGC